MARPWTFVVITVTMASESALGGMIIQHAGAQTAFLVAGALGLAGAAFGAFWNPTVTGPPPA